MGFSRDYVNLLREEEESKLKDLEGPGRSRNSVVTMLSGLLKLPKLASHGGPVGSECVPRVSSDGSIDSGPSNKRTSPRDGRKKPAKAQHSREAAALQVLERRLTGSSQHLITHNLYHPLDPKEAAALDTLYTAVHRALGVGHRSNIMSNPHGYRVHQVLLKHLTTPSKRRGFINSLLRRCGECWDTADPKVLADALKAMDNQALDYLVKKGDGICSSWTSQLVLGSGP